MYIVATALDCSFHHISLADWRDLLVFKNFKIVKSIISATGCNKILGRKIPLMDAVMYSLHITECWYWIKNHFHCYQIQCFLDVPKFVGNHEPNNIYVHFCWIVFKFWLVPRANPKNGIISVSSNLPIEFQGTLGLSSLIFFSFFVTNFRWSIHNSHDFPLFKGRNKPCHLACWSLIQQLSSVWWKERQDIFHFTWSTPKFNFWWIIQTFDVMDADEFAQHLDPSCKAEFFKSMTP